MINPKSHPGNETNICYELQRSMDLNKISEFKSKLSGLIPAPSKTILNTLLINGFSTYQSGNIYIIRYITILLKTGADPDINLFSNSVNKTEYNLIKTPLMVAVETSRLTLVKDLLESNCQVNLVDNHKRNCLFYLKGGKDDSEIIKLLLSKGVSINQRDDNNDTPLHYAIMSNSEKDASLLIEAGADFTLKNNKDISSIEMIFEKWNGKKELKKLLDQVNNCISLKKKSDVLEIVPFDSNNKDICIQYDNDVYVKMKPSPTIILNQERSKDKNEIKSEFEELTKINPKAAAYFQNLKEIYYRVFQGNNSYKNEIQIKDNIFSKKKNSLEEMNKKKNNLSASHKEELNLMKERYQTLLSKIQILKENIASAGKAKEPSLELNYQRKFFSIESYTDSYIVSQLQQDLLDFKDYVVYKISLMKPKLNDLVALIEKYVVDCLGSDHKIKVYGSHATGLCLPWSDIDIVVSTPAFDSYRPLYELYLYIQKQGIFNQIVYIGKTQVPLIKIVTNANFYNISIDISLEDNKHYGVQCVTFVNELIERYTILMPLTLAIKNILHKANLNDPYKGGLSSYGVILLIYNYLLMEQNRSNDISDKSLGRIFYDFLYYYGVAFDPSQGIIDVNNRPDLISNYQFQMINNELVIVDPLNIKNNVGKNTRQFGHIKSAFMFGYISAREPCECGCHYQYKEYCLSEQRVGHCLLKRIFNSVKRISLDELDNR